MNWGAHKADVRIAAKNSVSVRAALRTSINAKTIWAAYQDTHPYASDNITQDRARARAWAMLHVKINTEPIEAALKKVYTDGFLLGLDASKEAIAQAEKTQGKAITKSEPSDYIDWANWKPGNRAAALLYRPTGAFKTILDNAGIVSKTIAKAGYDRIGTALADSVAAGFSPARAAKVLTEKIGDPARALTIAITEQNRAMSLASMENYAKYGVEKIEWSGANPCDICAPNEGQVVETGQEFNSGDTEPPVHPNCRCAVLPVIDEAFYAEPSATDGLDLLPQDSADAPREEEMTEWQAGEEKPEEILRLNRWGVKEFGQMQEKQVGPLLTEREAESLAAYKGSQYEKINDYLRFGESSLRLSGLDPVEDSRIKTLWAEKIQGIDSAIQKANPLTEPIMTYRGVTQGDFAKELTKSSPGDVFADKGFTSTSFDKNVAEQFGVVQLEIINPVGTRGLALDSLVETGLGHEAEFLLPKNTKYQVVKNEKPNESNNQKHTITVRIIK